MESGECEQDLLVWYSRFWNGNKDFGMVSKLLMQSGRILTDNDSEQDVLVRYSRFRYGIEGLGMVFKLLEWYSRFWNGI